MISSASSTQGGGSAVLPSVRSMDATQETPQSRNDPAGNWMVDASFQHPVSVQNSSTLKLSSNILQISHRHEKDIDHKVTPFAITNNKKRPLPSDFDIHEEKRSRTEEGIEDVYLKVAVYKGHSIHVLKSIESDQDMLVDNQKRCINGGAVYKVMETTRVHIVGWLRGDSTLACVQVIFSSLNEEQLKASEWIPICLIKKENLAVAGLVLTPVVDCAKLKMQTNNFVDLGYSEEGYDKFLKERCTDLWAYIKKVNSSDSSILTVQ
ncbi:hypothetical protein BS50DRAFT_652785 [Corynespora cassiicola Philippines]|uniref:Uncharacterized protein n=1 Tax=Corynespora cassiicola Philippines TaxID=1448308 RepID=A0A2T2N7U8_CORCC|nr:hypothetical protein BS50DRAFT_652785 [Corynespora cassiicola Philippines]